MTKKAAPELGFIMPDSVAKFRAILTDDEKYTDEELANVLTFVGSLEVLFRAIPPYLPPIIRASLVANEFAPKVVAPLIEGGVIDPIAMNTYIEKIAEEQGVKKPDTKPKFLN